MNFEVHHGDCISVMQRWEENAVDALCGDPPYGLSFMNKAWDRLGNGDLWGQIFWHQRWAVEALRVMKPGAYGLVFSSSRTVQYLMIGLELAGFEIRDMIDWLYFNGFPKSSNNGSLGTALKPAKEPIVMVRKPLQEKSLDENLRVLGTGYLNINGCRVGERWPSNVIIDELVAVELDARCGDAGAKAPVKGTEPSVASTGLVTNPRARVKGAFHGDKGGPSRFFYCPKPSRAEREYGCEGLPLQTAGEMTDREDGSDGLKSPRAGAGRTGGARNHHPTLKPIALMQYLCRLITPKSGIVLDPFAGSGTTGIAALREGFKFVGIEKELPYLAIATARVSAAEREIHEACQVAAA